VRPSEWMLLVGGVIIALAGVAAGFAVFFDHSGGKYWFYWIAPLLMIGIGGLLIQLSIGYYRKVGRLEMKGRPRSG
jgi:acyl-coenzyme A thioesterase PaaI-like protein